MKLNFEIENDKLGVTPVANSFINIYMPEARGDYVKVYLYGLMVCFNRQAVSIDNDSLAQLFGISAEDVRNAWNYWQDRGILSIKYEEDGSADITYYNIASVILGTENHRENSQASEEEAVDLRTVDTDPGAEKFAFMFEKIQAMLGSRPLSKNAMMHLVAFNNEYGLEPEAIVLLVEYVLQIVAGKENDFNSAGIIKYMDAVAKNWQSQGVKTGSDAERIINKSRSDSRRLYEVLRYLGIRRSPIAWEKQMINSWFDDLNFDMEMIQTAIDRSSRQDVRYVNGILQKWHDKGIATPEEAQKENAGWKNKTPLVEGADAEKRQEAIDDLDTEDINFFIRRINDETKP